MKNLRTIRNLFALLLSLCMLFSGIPVLAQDGDFVTVTPDGEVEVTVGEVSGSDGYGILSYRSEDDLTVEVDGFWEEEEDDQKNLVNEELQEDLADADYPEVVSVTLNADSINEEYEFSPIPTDGDQYPMTEVAGVEVRNMGATEVNVNIPGDVDISVQNKEDEEDEEDEENEEDGEKPDSVEDHVTVAGISVTDVSTEDVNISAGNVDVSFTYTDPDPEQEDRITADLVGVEVCYDAYYDKGSEPEDGPVQAKIDVGNVTVTGESDASNPSLSIRGIDAVGDGLTETTLHAGNVTLSGHVESDAFTDTEVYRDEQGLSQYDNRITGVSIFGEADADIGRMDIDAVSEGENISTEVLGLRAGGENVRVEMSSMTAEAVSDDVTLVYGIMADAGAEVTADEVSLTAKGENAYIEPAIQAVDSASVETGKVTAEAVGEQQAAADAIFAMDSYVESSGAVEASAQGGTLAEATAVQAVGDAKVVVNGDVTAEAETTDAEGESHAEAIRIGALDNTVTTVIANGDVAATADEGTGILIERGYSPIKEETEEDAPTVNVIADGTVSGSTVAVQLTEDENLTAEDVNLTLWAAEENGDGEIARVYDADGLNKTASKALEAAINYIIRFTEGLTFNAISTEKGSQAEFLDRTYHTANEGESVMVRAANTDEKELAGIFYNADEEDSLQGVKDLEKDEDGNYVIKMDRGGGMNLGLKWHTHIYEEKEKDRVEPTCTADGSVTVETVCAECGKVAVSVKKTLPKTGHTPGEAVKENETAATCTQDGGYDLVIKCTVCGEEISREHVALEKTGHSAGEPVVENEIEATGEREGGYDLVVYCSVCREELSREHIVTERKKPESSNENSNPVSVNNLRVVRVTEDEYSKNVLDEAAKAEESGDALSFLPDEIPANLPEEYNRLIAKDSMMIAGDTDAFVSFVTNLQYEQQFTEGEKVYLLIGFRSAAAGGMKWYVLEGTAHENGKVTVDLTNLLHTLGNRQFVAILIGK